MQKIDPYRMLGRFDFAVQFLMNKYYLSTEEEAPDWRSLLMSLAQKVDDSDREFCMAMADAAPRYAEEAETSPSDTIEAERQRHKGTQEAKFIFRNQPEDYASYILADKDYLPEIKEMETRRRKEKRRNLYILYAIIALIVGTIIVYNLPYFGEKRAYSKVERIFDTGSEEDISEAVSQYLYQYPEGAHLSDVMYMQVRRVKDTDNPIMILNAVDNYLHYDPDGTYAKKCRAISDRIWDEAIRRYESSVGPEVSEKGKKYVVEMLKYMRARNVRTVVVGKEEEILIKEYAEYPEATRKKMESVSLGKGSRFPQGVSLPKLLDDMLTVKNEIREKTLEDCTVRIIMALQIAFDRVLGPEFINFILESETDGRNYSNLPKITVKYTFENQEWQDGFPSLAIYYSFMNDKRAHSQFFPVVQVKIDALFSLPGQRDRFDMAWTPEKEDAGATDEKPSMVIDYLTQKSTLEFALKLTEALGFGTHKNKVPQKQDN